MVQSLYEHRYLIKLNCNLIEISNVIYSGILTNCKGIILKIIKKNKGILCFLRHYSILLLYVFVDDMNKRGMKPLLFTLNKIGGWPIIMARNKGNRSYEKWQNIDDYYAHLTGYNLLHDVRVAAYGRNTKVLSVVVGNRSSSA